MRCTDRVDHFYLAQQRVKGPAANINCSRSAQLLTSIVTDRSQLHVKPHLGPHVISSTFTAFRLWHSNSLCAHCTSNTIRHGVKCRTWKTICTKGIFWLFFLINMIYLFIYLFIIFFYFRSFFLLSFIPLFPSYLTNQATTGHAHQALLQFQDTLHAHLSNYYALATSVKPAVTACNVHKSACRWTAVNL